MNGGAFGENFPYSNFHDLNMDWITKIAKDFLDQYTHIQEVITNGEQSLLNLTAGGLGQLQTKADALEALLQQWYDTHSQDIANQLADALSDLNQYLTDSINAFNQAADQKAQQTISTIPEDYTTLFNKVIDLKSAFMQEQASLEAVPLDGYVEIEGNMSDSGTWNNIMYSFKHIVIAVKPGDVVKIKCTANTLQIGFVKSYTKPVSGAAIDYSGATGFTGKIKPTSNVLNSYTVPSDVNFLIVEKVYSETELTFTDFTINGYDITESIGTHIVNIEDEIKNIPSLETEVNKIASEIIIGYGMNRYNPNDEDIIPSAYLNGEGTEMTANGAYFTSGYCNVENFSSLTIQKFNGTSGIVTVRAYEFYKEDKTYISGTARISITPTGIEVPSNAKYVRFSGDSGAESYMVIPGSSNYSGFVSYKEIYSATNQKSKTLIFNGDSIPYGYTSNGDVPYNYPKKMASCFGMKLKNYSIGGSTISEWGNGGDAPTNRNPIVDRYTEMADGDIIVIAAGTNDWHYGWCPPGEMTDRGKTTFYGALHTLCLGLLDKYPGKLIVFCTPIKRRKNNTTPMPNATNPYGKTLKEYCNIIKEVCDYYSIPVIDLYSESLLNPGIDAQMNLFIPDGVHPNQDGHDIIARRVINWFKQIIY